MVKNLTVEEFKDLVFDYVDAKEWKFKGDKPVVIDFYADWCQPCKTLAPIMEELNDENDGFDVYKVDSDEQSEIAGAFGIRNLPSMLMIPLEGQPQMVVGALPKETLQMAFNDVLLGIPQPNAGEITDNEIDDEVKK